MTVRDDTTGHDSPYSSEGGGGPHAETHADGGSDEVTPGSIGAATPAVIAVFQPRSGAATSADAGDGIQLDLDWLSDPGVPEITLPEPLHILLGPGTYDICVQARIVTDAPGVIVVEPDFLTAGPGPAGPVEYPEGNNGVIYRSIGHVGAGANPKELGFFLDAAAAITSLSDVVVTIIRVGPGPSL